MLAQNGIEYKNSHSGEPLWLLTVLRPPVFGAEGGARSLLVLELEVVEGDGVAVLDAHLFQALIEAGVPQGLLEPHAALVVVEVDVAHEALEPGALDEPGAVVGALDVQGV